MRLTHQAAESLECSRDAHVRVHFDQHAASRVDVHLQHAGLVQRRVEQREETLREVVVSAYAGRALL